MGGDELNHVQRGANYGYPIVSNGDHYDGKVIPDHPTRPEFKAPAAFWNPVISPSSLMFYSGSEFPQWQGDAFIGGLSSQSIVRIEFDGENAREAQRTRWACACARSSRGRTARSGCSRTSATAAAARAGYSGSRRATSTSAHRLDRHHGPPMARSFPIVPY